MTDEKSINQQIATGAIWMVGARFAVKGISLVSIMILARLLTPEDFGIIALASSIYAMIELMRAMGFDTVLIQKQNVGREYYDTAWTLQIIFSTFASLIMVLISEPVANYYGDLRLTPVLWLMAGMTFLNGLTNIGVVEFRKKMDFNKEFLFQVLVKLSGFLVTVPLAFYWKSYWAMLMGMLSTRFVSVCLSYYMQSFRPRPSLSKHEDVLGFSSWLFMNNILVYINQNGQNFIVAKLLGGQSLGVLSVSSELSNMTSDEIIAPINRAAYPGFAKVSNDKILLKKTYLSILPYIALLAALAGFSISALAPVLVKALLGDKWLEGVPIIEIISLASLFMALNTNSGSVFLAVGRPKILTYLMTVRLLLILPLLFYLIPQFGLMGVAYTFALGAFLLFPLSQYIAARIVGFSFRELITGIYRPIISGFIMLLLFRFTGLSTYLFDLSDYALINLIVSGICSSAIFVFFIVFFWNIAKRPVGAETLLLDTVRKKLKWGEV